MHAARLLVATALVAALARPALADDAPVQVLVLGVYHFANPGHDVHNTKVEDVLTPRRQAELADVAARLAKFKPTKIAVEAEVDAADAKYARYRSFAPADLRKSRDERVQIGFRVAKNLGLPDVYGVDMDGDFPYEALQKFAEKSPAAKARFAAINKQTEQDIAEFEKLQATSTTAELLAWYNDPAQIQKGAGFYYSANLLGEGKEQPGAELNAGWFLRNAKIFARLAQIAKPGDRIIVIFGAGHAAWLRHFAASTPGYQLVEANAYLK